MDSPKVISSHPTRNPQSEIRNPLQGHELWAEEYDHFTNPLLHLEERILSQQLISLNDLSVADLACGTGRWLRKARELGARFGVGIDFSPAMLHQAKAKAGLRGCLVLADLNFIPLATETLDILICSFALGYFETLNSLASECHRILRPGGRLFCSDLHPATQTEGWKRSFKKADRVIEIESVFHSIAGIMNAFGGYFQLESRQELFLGEPERPIFEGEKKLQVFEASKHFPAVILFQWRKPS